MNYKQQRTCDECGSRISSNLSMKEGRCYKHRIVQRGMNKGETAIEVGIHLTPRT